MRKLLVILLIMISAGAEAQTWQTTGTRMRWGGMGLPVKTSYTISPKDSAQLILDPSDSLMKYVYKGVFRPLLVNPNITLNGISTSLGSSAVLPDKRIDIFLIAGQSNAVGNGDSTGGIKVASGVALQYYLASLSGVLGDPVGNSSTGSAWPAFINTYYNNTGVKICMVPTALNSTAQTSAANIGPGTWDTDGSLYSTSVTALNNAVTALTAAGYTPKIRGILWCQGETDAGAITATTITKAQYKTALQTMIANYRLAFGSNLPFYIFRTGGSVTTGITAVREAQEETSDEQLFTFVVFRNAADFPTRSLQNGAHYLQAGYDEMGKVGCENILGIQKRTIVIQSDKIGINNKQPAFSLDVTGTLNTTGAVTLGSTLNVTGVPTFNTDITMGATTLTKSFGATAGVWQIGFFGTINSGTGNPLVLRTATTSQQVAFQNGATEAARFAGTTGNLLMGTTTDSPTSAMVNLTSTTKALLIMRMTKTQRNAISSPAAGMIVYQTDNTPGLRVYNGTNWMRYTETAD